MEFFPLAGSLKMPSLAVNIYNITPESMNCGKEVFQTFNLIAYPVCVLCHVYKDSKNGHKGSCFFGFFLFF